jgi:hypothetical protein
MFSFVSRSFLCLPSNGSLVSKKEEKKMSHRSKTDPFMGCWLPKELFFFLVRILKKTIGLSKLFFNEQYKGIFFKPNTRRYFCSWDIKVHIFQVAVRKQSPEKSLKL